MAINWTGAGVLNAAAHLDAMLEAAEPLIDLAIAEDVGAGDVTSESIIARSTLLTGRFVAKQRGIVAGLPLVRRVFDKMDPEILFDACVEDGSPVEAGELIATATGPGRSLLSAERIALNFLQRLSGIATATKAYVDAVATTDAQVLDTRKTLPGYRLLDKYAVWVGGGTNHRMGLFDMVLVKDNHVDAAASLTDAVDAARRANPDLPVEVEVRDLSELKQVLTLEPYPDRVLLDNMDIASLREAVQLVDRRIPLEASGGVALTNVGAIAATGVDAISVGALTHSAKAFDVSMKTARSAVTRDSLMQRARRLKRELSGRITVLGHHYQRDEIIELSDLSGDSLGLARDAAATDTEFIIFCGVHFMAETAAILAGPGQHVLSPDIDAGCYLADTASPDSVEEVWGRLDAALGGAEGQVMPVTYVNSSAELKAFCGRHGGTVCTSGNAEAILGWAFEQRPRVLFFPDQHLGRNIGYRLGVADNEMLLLDANASADSIRSARMFLWPGACNVHRRFRAEHLRAVREDHPDAQIIVHPECTSDVVGHADDSGSTAHIIRRLAAAPAGTTWAVGTEARLVHRLNRQHPDKTVMPLAAAPAYCSTMSQITLDKLVNVFEAIHEGRLYNEVTVEPEVSRWARIALERMLEQS